MSDCSHKNLVLLVEQTPNRVRCKHCFLTISKDELADGYCPECFERDGKRRKDFEEVEDIKPDKTRYRCEDCRIIVEC